MRVIIDETIDIPASSYGCRVYAATYSPDGEILAYGGGGWYSDGFIRCRWPDGHVVTQDRGFETPQVGSGLSLEALCFIGDTPTVAAANRAGYISLWENGEDRGHWWLPDGSPRCLACHPGGRYLAVGCKGTVHPEEETAKMLSYEKPIEPKTQSVREGRLLVYDLDES